MKISAILLSVFASALVCGIGLAGELDTFLESRSIVGQIYFTRGKSQLLTEHKQNLTSLSQSLKKQKSTDRLIRVEGFASPEGDEPTNYDLSMQRAIAVKNYLQQQGVTAELFLTGYGENSNSTAKLSERRRVDIAIYQETRVVKQLFQETGRIERFVIQ